MLEENTVGVDKQEHPGGPRVVVGHIDPIPADKIMNVGTVLDTPLKVDPVTRMLANPNKRLRPKITASESGWVIEHENSQVSAPLYACVQSDTTLTWEKDHLKALRFARKEDAERFAGREFGIVHKHRVCEHAWDKVEYVLPGQEAS